MSRCRSRSARPQVLRDMNDEGCSFVDGTLDIDRPVVSKDDALDDSEAEACARASVVAGTGIETLKDAGQILGGNSLAGIRNTQDDMKIVCSSGHGNRTSLREVIGVFNEVDEHLQQHQTVTVQEPSFAVDRKAQGDTCLVSLFVKQLCQIVLHLTDVHKFDLWRCVLEAREQRDVGGKSDETIDVALDDVEIPDIARFFAQQFEVSPDGGQGRLEFVGGVRNKVGLDAWQHHGIGDVVKDEQHAPFVKCRAVQFVDAAGIVPTVVLDGDCL